MVVQRQELLHQARFLQQGAQLARGLVDLDPLDLARDAHVVRRAVVAGEMGTDAIAQVDALADVDRKVVHAVETIDAGAFGQSLERVGCELRRQARDLEEPLHRGLDLVGFALAVEHLDEAPHRARIAQRGMAPGAHRAVRRDRVLQPVTRDERVQPVADGLRIELARQAHGAQHVRRELHLQAAELVLDEAVIEARVVRDEDVALEALEHLAAQFGEGWRAAHHLVGDAGEDADVLGDAAFRVHQRGPLVHELAVGDAHDADLGDAVPGGSGPRGLEVHEGDGRCEHRADCSG